jgi:tetratricopeptide (TPR) repeat protein
MNIKAILQRLTGSKTSYERNGCPIEADILTYAEGNLSSSNRTRLEAHLAKCDDCRELLVFTVRETSDVRSTEMVSDKEVKLQTARVLAYIERDESKRRRASNEPMSRREPVKAGLYLSYPKLASVALVVCAVTAVSVRLITSDRRPAEAMAALRLAMKDERRNEALISGNIDYSHYVPKRGARGSDDPVVSGDVNYESALNKVRYAEKETAPVESRHVLARALLAMGKRDEARTALAILQQLEAAGTQSPDLFNDLGVAELQLGNYDGAIDHFRRALERSPSASMFLFNKALAEERAGRLDDAREDWTRFINMSADDRLKTEARSHLDWPH